MPIIKSAKKRVRTAEKAAIRNSKTKRTLKTALKAFRSAAANGESTVAKLHSDIQSNVDKAAKKGLVHKNKAARQKAQLAKIAKAAAGTGVKPAAKKTTAAKKAATAKAAPAKTTAKPATAKKPTVSKVPATKRPAAKKVAPKK